MEVIGYSCHEIMRLMLRFDLRCCLQCALRLDTGHHCPFMFMMRFSLLASDNIDYEFSMQAKAARENFKQFLLNSPRITPESQWRTTEPLLRDSEQYRTLQSMRIREVWLHDRG